MDSAIMQTYGRTNMAFERGVGPYLFTADDERFLDFGSGIAVTSLGHAHPKLVDALTEQAERLWHVSNLYIIPDQERLARRLVQHSFADQVFFANSGAEAMECAVKVARKYHAEGGNPERYRIITVEGAFHGRTLAMIAAAGQEKLVEGFGPPVEGFDSVPSTAADVLEAAITPETAAILIEPVQGESGVRVVPEADLHAARAIADRHGLLLIFDEVQCGMGRTGKLFAHEWSGVTPDIMALAKALGGGFPMGACLATREAAKGMKPGTHGSTFGGNPLAMAVGNAVLDVMLEDGFFQHVQDMANYLRQQLVRLQDDHGDIIEEIRGMGLMIGLKCRVPNGDLAAALAQQKMLTIVAGDNVVRLLPALTIDETHITEAMEKLDAACAHMRAAR